MSDAVKLIQSRLAALGYDVGPIDGDLGPRTEKAIKTFQIVKGLEVDGIPGPQTRKALGITPADIGAAPQGEEPEWLTEARGYIGLKEIVGPRHNPEVLALWVKAHVPGVNTDEVPWCAAAVSAWLEEVGIRSARTGWARGYQKWGEKTEPFVGAIVVFERGPNAGHVGVLVGKDRRGNLMILGGNQSNAVNIRPFDPGRVLGYRKPKGYAPKSYALPIVNSDGRVSRNEA